MFSSKSNPAIAAERRGPSARSQRTTSEHAVELLRAENHIFDLMAHNVPLPRLLDEVARAAESLVSEEVLCSILLLDDAGQRLLHGAAPNLPAAYNEKIHGLEIGEGVGSCGTAAATGNEAVAIDIATHPHWAAFKDLALSHGLRACWSTPILSSAGDVLGTFAMYHRQPAAPTDQARVVVQLLSRTTALVLERQRAERRRKQSADRLEALNRTGLYLAGEHDLQTIVQVATDAAREVSGADFGAFFYNVVNEQGESYTLYTISGVPREAFSKFPMPRNTRVFGPTFRGEGVVRSDDITKDPRYGHNAPYNGMPPGHLKVTSYLAVPVKSRTGEVIGGMFFGHPRAAVFNEESERLVSSIAAQAGVAMDNARLHKELTQRIAQHVETESRLRTAQQIARLATWEWDASLDRFTFNAGSAEIFGNPLASIRNRADWLAQIVDGDRQRVMNTFSAAVESGQDYRVEYRVRAGDGVRWILTLGHPVRDEHSGAVISLLGVSTEITERREAEEAQKEAESRFHLVLESSDLGFWYCDLPFSELMWDAKVKEHFWFAADERVTITDFYLRLHPEDREPTRQAIEHSIRDHAGYDIDYRTVSPKTGEIKWIRAVGRTFYNAAGEPIRFDGITMDVSERKRGEEALKASEKLAATGRLAATIAHEINNPLEAVTNFIYLAKTNRGLSEEVRQQLEIADQELARVTHIAQQTLGFYRDTTEPVAVSISDVLKDVLAIYERRMSYKSLRVDRQIDTGLVITGLQGEIRQIFSNLIGNAIDATGTGGRLCVRAHSTLDHHSQQQGIRVVIADTGHGIEPNLRCKVFTPFFTTKKDVGTGLGLWVTKGMVEKHRGTIRFRSRHSGSDHGTVFSVFLPKAGLVRRGASQAA